MKVKIQFIRNATMKITYGGKTFLTDPVLAEKGSWNGFIERDKMVNPLIELPMTKEEVLEGVDSILVTHTHIPAGEDEPSSPSDHFDPEAIRSIPKNSNIIVQDSDAKGLKRLGFNNILPVDREIEWEGISIERVAGKHVDIKELEDLVGESSGYILRNENRPSIFWIGDSLLTEEIKETIKRNKPEIIIVHSGRAQLVINEKGERATLLMGIEETIEVLKLSPLSKIIAIHMDALDHCTVTKTDLKEALEARGIPKENYFIPSEGEILEF